MFLHVRTIIFWPATPLVARGYAGWVYSELMQILDN